MLNSKKRKIIKIVALSASSLAIASSTTIGIVYSQNSGNNRDTLIQRQNRVTLDGNGKAQDVYNSNRDVNLPDQPTPPTKTPVVQEQPKPDKKPEPKPLPQPKPADPNDTFAQTTSIKYVTYDKEDYGLDANAPQQPNDPSKVVLSDSEARALYEKTKASISRVKAALEKAKALGAAGAKDTAARDLFLKESGYSNNKDFFNIFWEKLFTESTRGKTKIDWLLDSINSFNNDGFIMSEAKSNRSWKININPDFTGNVSFGYSDEDSNPVIKYQKDVYRYQVLGTPNKWAIDNPRDILEGGFTGWTRTDLTDEFVKDSKYGISYDDGISVRHYTPENKSDPYYADKKDLNVFVLDVDKTSGYQKFIDFLNKAKDTTPEIGVVLQNVGKSNTTRNVYDIIKALPSNVVTLTVFFENADTTSLLALEGRHLRELKIYTTGRVNTPLWSINPLALKNINFIPSLLAYNVGGYPRGTTVASTPIIGKLKFDRNDDYKRIQEGLDIAKARRNERIFQGYFQGAGAKPVAWDFSSDPIIRTLQNINVHDAELRELTLSSELIDTDENGNMLVTYDLSEFNHAQFDQALRYRGPSNDRYIYFGKGTEILQPESLILKGEAKDLEQGSVIELTQFVHYATTGGAFKKVFTSSQAVADAINSAAKGWRTKPQVIVVDASKLEKYKPKVFHIDPNLNPIGIPLNKTK
ncbi:putative immunoglobulin-blocking virulence protein [Mycoplasma tullyi]|uniref:Putative immunoglobulin-blocking virulence protein n=1 Tax=Mycoplasma tullyi TaxID=1612150 RepID=A0A7D7XWL0_9MOLU|nr:putative immunoglobulin-blocking virulence protein [Mycoplasma tullyi]QMT98513.1 putative immunoglobulin-blocking virulence protein [Mycoplasma tullyi]